MPNYAAQFGAQGPLPMTGGISPKMQAEMKQFEEEFAGLSPKEQDEFFASLDQAVKKIDDLSKTEDGKKVLAKLESGAITDEELDGLINQLVEEEPVALEQEPVVPVHEEKQPVIPKQVLTSKHERAIAAINDLIASINSSLVKAATVPEFPSKMRNWIKKKEVALQASTTWNTVKKDLEQLVTLLSRLLERDPKTSEYYHIDALLKNESLLNNIQKIQRTVAEIEPKVQEVPLLGGRRMKASSKRAYQALLNEYNEALYILNLPQGLQSLFALFDPVAKTYRETEEKAVQAAGTKKQVLYTGAPGRYTAPSDYDTFVGGDYGYEDYTPTGYGAPSTYIPSASGRGFGPIASPQSQQNRPGQRRPARAAAKSGSMQKGESQDQKIGEDGGEKKEEQKIEVPKEVVALQKDINASMKKIQDKLKDAAEFIKDQKLIEKVKTEFIDTTPIDTAFIFETLPELSSDLNIKKGVLGEIHQLHRKLKQLPARQSVQKKLQRAYDAHKKELDGLLKNLSALQADWDSKSKAIPEEKQVSYFGTEPEKKEIDEEEEIEQPEQQPQTYLKAPYSLFDIQTGIKKVKSAISDFTKAQLPKE